MKINQNTVIIGDKVILLPYEEIHVEKYHSWMQSKEIRQLTASEPLTLQEEYAMQKSWREDDDKLTFVLADRQMWKKFDSVQFQSTAAQNQLNPELALDREISCIVGDVNLFLNDNTSKHTAEIEIMIAEPWARKKGLATEALKLTMAYGLKYMQLTSYVAKIGFANMPSINLFVEKLRFSETSRSEIFEEVTLQRTFHDMQCEITETILQQLHIHDVDSRFGKYHDFRLMI